MAGHVRAISNFNSLLGPCRPRGKRKPRGARDSFRSTTAVGLNAGSCVCRSRIDCYERAWTVALLRARLRRAHCLVRCLREPVQSSTEWDFDSSQATGIRMRFAACRPGLRSRIDAFRSTRHSATKSSSRGRDCHSGKSDERSPRRTTRTARCPSGYMDIEEAGRRLGRALFAPATEVSSQGREFGCVSTLSARST